MPKDYSHLDRDVITAGEACKILGIGHTLHRFLRKIDNPPPIEWKMGGQARYKREDIIKFKAECANYKQQIHAFAHEANKQSAKTYKEKFELFGENIPPLVMKFIRTKTILDTHAAKFKY